MSGRRNGAGPIEALPIWPGISTPPSRMSRRTRDRRSISAVVRARPAWPGCGSAEAGHYRHRPFRRTGGHRPAAAGTTAVERSRRGSPFALPLGRCCRACSRGGAADLIISRHGLMFFPEPVTALAAIRAGAGEGASLIFSCFGDRARNRFATIADDVTGSTGSFPRLCSRPLRLFRCGSGGRLAGGGGLESSDRRAGRLRLCRWRGRRSRRRCGVLPVADRRGRPAAGRSDGRRPADHAGPALRDPVGPSHRRSGDIAGLRLDLAGENGSASSNIMPDRFRPPMR